MLEQWWAKRGLQKLERARDREYAELRASFRKQDDENEWWSGWDGDITPAREDYERARTSHWVRRAVGRLVELPPRREQDGYWRQTSDTGKWVLTTEELRTFGLQCAWRSWRVARWGLD